VGADRKGPLVAFIVVAIIAAILLITSVRSQAATGRLGRAVPSAPVSPSWSGARPTTKAGHIQPDHGRQLGRREVTGQ
jgi:hypothetical protein